MAGALNFCPDCGGTLQSRTPSGFDRTRYWCGSCAAYVHDHPAIILTCFVSCGVKLLWMQRKFEPRSGLWAIPGGFMEPGEGLAEGAVRELREETGIALPPQALELYMTGSITFINQVYVAFRAMVESEDCKPGAESLAAAFLSRQECPWDQVAYPEVNNSINRAYDDLERSRFGVYQAEMTEHSYRLEEVPTTRC